MSAFRAELNLTEQTWLDGVHAALVSRGDAGPITLAEIGNLCPRSKTVKSKCRKVTDMIESDRRFTLLEGDKVKLNTDVGASEIGPTIHGSFLLFMSSLPEEDVVDSEMHHHLEKHYTIWKMNAASEQHPGIEEIHLTQLIDTLKEHKQAHTHKETSRLLLETYTGRIKARLAALDSEILSDLDDQTGEHAGAHSETVGAYSNITGTNYKNVKFLDFNEYELAMFGDTGIDHGYVVRGPNYFLDDQKLDTGMIY